MKNYKLWLFSALMGLLFIFLLNTSPLSRMGFGIDLPWGWEGEPTVTYRNCTIEEQLSDPVANLCEPTCPDIRRPAEGFPFSNTRQGRSNHCGTDTNILATLLNLFTGIGIGILYSFTTQKYWPAKKPR